MAALPDDALQAVRDAIARGQLIEAIKIYRERTGASLKESKDAVDSIAAGLKPPTDRSSPATGALREEDIARLREMLRRGEKIPAIREYRVMTNSGLKEAMDAVELIATGMPLRADTAPPAAGPLTEEFLAGLREMLRRGEKIQAIKEYRERTGLGLKEAKDAVDALEMRPAVNAPQALPLGQMTQVQPKRGGCLGLLLLAVVVGTLLASCCPR